MSKANVWGIFTEMLYRVPGVQFNRSELSVTFPNQSVIQLLGGDEGNYNALRGRKFHFVVLDESQHIPQVAWDEVIRPALADTKGGALITGTAYGRHNFLHSALTYSQSGEDPEWSAHVIPVTQSTAIDASELEKIRRSLSDRAFRQEFLVDFGVAVPGAYFADEVSAIERESRCTLIMEALKNLGIGP